jgi:hypothetical protein
MDFGLTGRSHTGSGAVKDRLMMIVLEKPIVGAPYYHDEFDPSNDCGKFAPA